jgi:hypothetical protein
MTAKEQIETEIRELLATETRTTVLSNRLFQQGTGLFAQLATTEDERRALVQTESGNFSTVTRKHCERPLALCSSGFLIPRCG